MSTTAEVPKIIPPYLSIRKLKDLFILLETRSFTQITRDELTARGFSPIDAFLALSTLRFLHIIDDNNSGTENLHSLRMVGEEKKNTLKEIVKSGYKKIFDTVPEANNLTRSELYNEFIATYRLSPRLASAAVPDFLWLCGEAGLKVQKAVEVGNNRPRHVKTSFQIKPRIKTYKEKPEPEISANQGFVIPYGSIKLVLPNNDKARNALVDGQFKEVGKQLLELSKLVEDKVSEESKEH